MLKLGYAGLGKYYKFDESLKILIYSTFFYILWIYFFQNIIFKSRHVLPVLIIIFVILVLGQKYIFNTRSFLINFVLFIYIFNSAAVTSQLVLQHKQPNAISKLKDSVSALPTSANIISFPLINFYLKSHGLKNNFININNISDFNSLEIDMLENSYVLGNFHAHDIEIFDLVVEEVFFHNPFVNRMWPELYRYRVVKNK
jgi:hypothetical protein